MTRNPILPLLALLLSAMVAQADTPLTIDEFESRVTGKVMQHFAGSPLAYGAEEYLPNRKARWAFADGSCMMGHYYADKDYICFQYDDGGTPDCWHYFDGHNGLTAFFRDQGDDPLQYQLRETTDPLVCTGPDVGV